MADETKTGEDGSSYVEGTKWTRREVHRAARAAHEVNRALCEAQGDRTQLPWDEAPGWAVASAAAGAEAIALDPAITPEESHESWAAMKRADGWTYGPEKDTERKLHPCLVPYEELPVSQRVKDALFGITVRAMLGIEFETEIHVTDRRGDDEPTDPDRPMPRDPKTGQIGQ